MLGIVHMRRRFLSLTDQHGVVPVAPQSNFTRFAYGKVSVFVLSSTLLHVYLGV